MRIPLALTISLAACGPAHERLPEAPSPSAALADRWAWYQRFAPEAVDDVRTDVRVRGMHCWTHDHWRLALADGSIVEDPADLLPEVAPTSATAQAARHSIRARHQRWILVAAGLATAAVSVGLTGLVAADHRSPDLMFGVAFVGVGLGLTEVGFGIARGEAVDADTLAAFRSYNTDLRARLRLCSDGLRVVTCTD